MSTDTHQIRTAPGPATSVAQQITGAVVGSFLVNVVSLAGFALPGNDEVPAGAKVVAVAFGALALVGIWALLQGRRWGAWFSIVLTALNALTALPALFDPPSTSMGVLIAIAIPIAVAVVVILSRSSVRRSLH